MAEYIEAAIAAGLDEIGLSDHGSIQHLGDVDPALPHYVREMVALRDQYAGRITVRLGIESDYVEGYEETYRQLWQQYSLDYVIGSVHFLGEWAIFHKQAPAGKTLQAVYADYLRATQLAARIGIYDIIGHLDALKTNGYLPSPAITPLLEETIQVITDADVAIELNTHGWRKACSDCFPSREILARCFHWGCPSPSARMRTRQPMWPPVSTRPSQCSGRSGTRRLRPSRSVAGPWFRSQKSRCRHPPLFQGVDAFLRPGRTNTTDLELA